MPRRFWPRKDAYGGDTRRVGAINLRSGDVRMGKPLAFARAKHKNVSAMVYIVFGGERRELKHLSNARKRNQ